MTALYRILIEVVGGLLLVWGTVMYLEHRGAAACKAADATAVTAQEARNAVKSATDTKTINQEASTYAQTLAAPDPIDSPHVSVCYYSTPRAVPQAATARPLPDAANALRSPDPVPAVPGPDIGPSLVRLGRIADALAAQRADYVTKVCLTP
jgi:hypothetical protein